MAGRQKPRKPAVTELIIPDVADAPPLLTPPTAQSGGVRREPTKQSSQKTNCLCSPTTHAGSFRCRHHRGSSNLMRGSASVGSGLSEYSLPPRQSSALYEHLAGGNGGSSFGSHLSELPNMETAAGDTSAVRV